MPRRLRPPSHAVSDGSAPSSGGSSPRALDFYAPEAATAAAVPAEDSLQQEQEPMPVEDSLQQARESLMDFRVGFHYVSSVVLAFPLPRYAKGSCKWRSRVTKHDVT